MGQKAFEGTLLAHFVIPPSLCYIGAGAFPPRCKFEHSPDPHRGLIPQWQARFLINPLAEFDCRDLADPRPILDYALDFGCYHDFPDPANSLISRNMRGEVRLYEHNETHGQIAVKGYWGNANRVMSSDRQDQFIHEIAMLMRLQHPCVVALTGYSLPVGIDGPKVAMPYVGPHSLQSVIGSGESPVWWTETAKSIVIIGIVIGMYVIHTDGICHRNLKPSNVLLDPDTHFPKIADFESSQFEAAGFIVPYESGSLGYIAPELYTDAPPTPQVDVFSFGVILYEIVVGWPAFDPQLSACQLMNHVCSGKRPVIPPTVSAFVRTLIQRCWDNAPAKRPSFDEIFISLRENGFNIRPDVDPNSVKEFLEHNIKI
jgi:serine/threonine protein kinase